MSNLLSLEFRAKSAIDQSKKFSAHDARRRTTKTKSDGCIMRAERMKLVPKAGSSNTLSAGFLDSQSQHTVSNITHLLIDNHATVA